MPHGPRISEILMVRERGCPSCNRPLESFASRSGASGLQSGLGRLPAA